MGRGRIALLGFVLNAALGLALLMLAGTATEAGSRLEGSERVCVEAALGAYLGVDDELEVTGQGDRELRLVGDVVRADDRVAVDLRCRVSYDGDRAVLEGVEEW